MLLRFNFRQVESVGTYVIYSVPDSLSHIGSRVLRFQVNEEETLEAVIGFGSQRNDFIVFRLAC